MCCIAMQGIGTGFGTGSAAPWQGDTSIKDVTALFNTPHNSVDMGALSPEQQAAAQVGVLEQSGFCA
jgi:hypothetical protein